MSELTIIAIRVGFVLALWLFVVAVVLVLRNDHRRQPLEPRSASGPAPQR